MLLLLFFIITSSLNQMSVGGFEMNKKKVKTKTTPLPVTIKENNNKIISFVRFNWSHKLLKHLLLCGNKRKNTLNLLTCVYWFESFWLKSTLMVIIIYFIYISIFQFKGSFLWLNKSYKNISIVIKHFPWQNIIYKAYLYRHYFNVWSKRFSCFFLFYFHWFIQNVKMNFLFFYCYMKSHKRKSVDICYFIFLCSA